MRTAKDVEEVCKKLKPVIGSEAEKLWYMYLAEDEKSSVAYIHGEDVTLKLGVKNSNCGIFLPPVDKNDFFRTVVMDSAFPRKTFSMGEAHEKRFYVESRRIR